MFEKNLTDLIRGIRANKKHEQKYIATCLQEIHQEVKCNDPDVKAMAISKLTYLQMLGYDMSWASFHVVEVMSSPKFVQKRTGYLAAAQSFRQDTDVLMLTTNLLKKDLASGNHLEVGIALNGLSHLVTPDLARDLCQDLVSMLNHSRPYIRKKVVLVLYKIFLKFPEALRISFPRLKEKLDDPDPSVVCAVVNVICELARKNPKNYLSLAPQLFRLLSSSQNNWMLIKIIKLFGALTPLEPRLAKKLLSPITIQIQTTSAMSLLYECIHTAITGGMLNLGGANSDSLAAMCVSKLITFLEDIDQNLKYVGLLALAKILPTHTRLVSEHRDIILKLIDDPDISIRLRALDLVVGMVNKRNLTDIVKRLMSHLLPSNNNNSSTLNLHSSSTTLLEPAYRADIITRIIYICSQNSYSNITNFEWYIAVLIDITQIAGVKVGDMLTLQMMDIGVRVKSSRDYCVKAMQNLLSDSKMIENCKLLDSNSEVLYAAAWIVGEYSSYLENPQEAIKYLIQPGVTKLPHNVQAVYVHTILKIYSYWSNNLICNWNEDTKSELIKFTAFLKEKTGMFCSCTDLEVQERAYNVREIFSIIHQQLMTIDENYSTEQTNIYSFENKAPSVITELSELFFSYELNPVAPKAQKKVPIPEGLDLDAWINEPLPDTDSDSSEEQLEESYGYGYGQKLGGSGDLVFSSGNDTAFGRRRVRKNGKKFGNESEENKEVLEKRRKERKERNKNDPYYIEVDNASSIKKSKSNESEPTSTLSHIKNENIDVDLIPVVRLTMDEFDFKSTSKKSKSKRTKKVNKKEQNQTTSPLKPQSSASLTTTPVVIYTDIGEMPENAIISDDEKDTTKEIFEQKIWNNSKSVRAAGGILDVDFSGIANVDLSTPLGEDEKLPQITVYSSPEELRIKEVERVKQLLAERQAKILSGKLNSSKKSSKSKKSKTEPSTKSSNSKSVEKVSKKISKKKVNEETSEKPIKKKKEAITTTTTKKKKKKPHSENQVSEKVPKSSKLPIKTLIDSENFKIAYTLRLAASTEIKNEAPLLYVNFIIVNKCSMDISQMSFMFESTSDINFESKMIEVKDTLTVNGEKEISIPFKVLGIVGVGLEVTGTFNYTIQITNESSTETKDNDNININSGSNSIPIKFELPLAVFMLDIPKISPDEFISYVSKTSDFPFTGSTSYHLRNAFDPNDDISNSIDKPIEEIFHNSLENLTMTATGTNIVEQVTGAITFYGKSVQGYQVAGLAKLTKRAFSTSNVSNAAKVAVLGAAGGIGQPLSLLLKHNELITNLSLYDIVNTPGVAADLSHINTASKVSGFLPENDGLQHAITGADIIVIPAGVPRKPNMTRDDLFNTNASIARDLAVAAAKYAPEAHLAVISNPVNSTVPIVSEIFKAYGVYNPKKVFGVTTLDFVRASRFVSELKGTNPKNEKITVVGGHSGVTIIPLLSQIESKFTEEEIKALTHRIQFGGDEVVKAKAGAGSATLSMAYAAAHFTDSLLRAIVNGEKGIIEPAYVKSELFSEQGIDYFASNVELSSEGVGKVHPLGELSAYEKELLSAALPELKKNIDKGVSFVKNSK